MRHCFALLVTVALTTAVSAQSIPEAVMAVTVVDTVGTPIAGASVQALGTDRRAITDAVGAAELRLAPGSSILMVSASGYESASFTVDVAAGDRLEGTVELAPAPRILGAVETTAERPRTELVRAGFYERREGGRGEYLDRDEIEARSLHTVRSALTGMSGIQIITWDGARVAVSSRSVTGANGALQDAKPCPLSVFIDGQEVPGETIDLEGYPTADLAGLEVYVGTARTPPEYGQFNPCGVILLWTRIE